MAESYKFFRKYLDLRGNELAYEHDRECQTSVLKRAEFHIQRLWKKHWLREQENWRTKKAASASLVLS